MDHFAQWASTGEAVSSYFVANLWLMYAAVGIVPAAKIFKTKISTC